LTRIKGHHGAGVGVRIGVVAGLVVGATALAGTGVATATGSGAAPIVICEDAAFSGAFAQIGSGSALGTAAYVKMINAEGGMSGHQVKIIQEDNQSEPATAASVARKCVTEEHANFVFGPEETSTTSGAVPVLNSLKTVSIGWQSGWNDIGLSEADRHSYAFPGTANVFHENDLAAVQILVKKYHYTRVGVLETSAPGGLGNNTYLESIEGQYGFKVVGTQIMTPTATDDTPSVLALLADKPQIVISGLIPGPDTITAIKALRAADPTIPFAACVECDVPSFVSAVGGASAMKGIYTTAAPQFTLAALPRTPANAATIADLTKYVSAMKAAGYGSALDLAAAGAGWNSAEQLDAAIKAAGSVSETAVRDALEHQSIDTSGIQFKRTPENYGAITSDALGITILTPSGQVKVIGTAPGGPGE
jgi:ABC-type branched-subunit amino acid transport system substrate-binding protein